MLNSASVYFTELKFNLFDKLRNILFMLQIRKTEGGRERDVHTFTKTMNIVSFYDQRKRVFVFLTVVHKKNRFNDFFSLVIIYRVESI